MKITSVSQLDSLINTGSGVIDRSVLSREMLHLLDVYSAGYLMMQQSNLSEAIRIYRQLLTLAPDFVAPRVNLINCLLLAGHPHEALQESEYASRIAPGDVDIYIAASRVYSELGDFDNEIRMYERALQIDPRHFQALNNLGATYRMMAQLDLSEQWLLRALEEAESIWGSDSQKLMALHNLAITCLEKGEVEKSIKYWQQCRDIDPSNPEFKKLLQKVEEKKRIQDTVSPIRTNDGTLVAPEGYSLILSGYGSTIGPMSEPVKETEVQGWLDIGYKLELVKNK
jgi:tetratricopeptide (TPR) repeat protein